MSRMPQVTAAELIRFLRRQGFVEVRQTGSHVILERHSAPRISVPIPVHQGRDLKRAVAMTILKQAGFTVDDYLRLR